MNWRYLTLCPGWSPMFCAWDAIICSSTVDVILWFLNSIFWLEPIVRYSFFVCLAYQGGNSANQAPLPFVDRLFSLASLFSSLIDDSTSLFLHVHCYFVPALCRWPSVPFLAWYKLLFNHWIFSATVGFLAQCWTVCQDKLCIKNLSDCFSWLLVIFFATVWAIRTFGWVTLAGLRWCWWV
jgi:hypothetical protein